MTWVFALAAGTVALCGVSGCGNHCDFVVRCSGHAVERCGLPDQWMHRRVAIEEVCEAPNACVQPRSEVAICASVARGPRCDDSFVDHCEGSRKVYCPHRFYESGRFVVEKECARLHTLDGKVVAGRCVQSGSYPHCETMSGGLIDTEPRYSD